MGFQTPSSSSGSGSGFGSRSTPQTLAEINVTPLVDVMLVLLIIFMISAPLMQSGVQVDLPKTAGLAIDSPQEQLVLVIDSSRKLYLSDHLIERQQLFSKLKAIVTAKPSIEVAIQADQKLSYGYVTQVMGEIKRAGIQKVGLVTEAVSHL